MNTFLAYIEYSIFTFIAFTHKTVALCLATTLGDANIGLELTGKALQLCVLFLTGLGACIRIYYDWKDRDKK